MNPYYYRALKQASKCNTSEIEKYIENNKNILDNKTTENLVKLKDFIVYANGDEAFKYWNIFEILKIGETSITELLKCLFDLGCMAMRYGIDQYKECIEYKFAINFLQEITRFDDKIKSYSCIPLRHDIDILLKVETNSNKEYIYVIENKKNADLSITKRDNSEEYQTQIEKYYSCRFYRFCTNK